MTPDQRFLVRSIFAYWREHFTWPTLRYMIGVLKREKDLNLEDVFRGIPARTIMASVPGQDIEPMRLAVRALPSCPGAGFITKVFLAFHRAAAEVFIAGPLKDPRIGAAELKSLFPNASEKEFEALSAFVFEEFIGGSSRGDMKTWSKELGYPILQYAKVKHLSQWLKLRDAMWKEVDVLGESHLHLLRAVYRAWRKTGNWPDYRELLVELRDRGNIVKTYKEIPKPHFARERADGPAPQQRLWFELEFEGIAATGRADDDLETLAAATSLLCKHFISPEGEKPYGSGTLANELKLDSSGLSRLRYLIPHAIAENITERDDGSWQIVPSQNIRRFENVKNLDDFFKVLYPNWKEPWKLAVVRKPRREEELGTWIDFETPGNPLHFAAGPIVRPAIMPKPARRKQGHIGPYRLAEKLGEGANGVVWRALDAYGREQAIKLFKTALSVADKNKLSREVSIAAKLRHPGLVRYLSTSLEEIDGTQFIRMELVRGTSLKDKSRWKDDKCIPQPLDQVVGFLKSVVEPLGALHRNGVIHRDLHSGNVIQSDAGNAMLVDYGSARMLSTGEGNTTFKVPGSVSHAAPEKWLKPSRVGPSSDYFSLGVILYLITTGKLPFWKEGVGELHLQIAQKDPVNPSSLRRDIPKWLNSTIRRLLDRDPKRRLQSPSLIAKVIDLAGSDPGAAEKLVSRVPAR